MRQVISVVLGAAAITFVLWYFGVVGDRNRPFDRATRLYRADHYAEAVPLFEEHLRAHPNDALANARLGICLGEMKRLDEAIPYFKKAIELDATDYQSRSNLAVAYTRLGRAQEGVRWAREAAKIRPDDPGVRRNLEFVLSEARKSTR